MLILRRRSGFAFRTNPPGWASWNNDRKRWFYLSEDLQKWWGWFLLPPDLKDQILNYHSTNQNVEDDSSHLTFAGARAQHRASKINRV